MRLTKEQIKQDDIRWGAKDVMEELKQASSYMLDYTKMTNLDVRFYLWLFRRALEKIKQLEWDKDTLVNNNNNFNKPIKCNNCSRVYLIGDTQYFKFCPNCGKKMIGEQNEDK